jgi:hypothetical protein
MPLAVNNLQDSGANARSIGSCDRTFSLRSGPKNGFNVAAVSRQVELSQTEKSSYPPLRRHCKWLLSLSTDRLLSYPGLTTQLVA